MLTTEQSYATYLGNGATTQFPYNFLVQAASQLVVSITNNNVSPAVTTVLSTTQYSVTGIGNQTGGTVTYPVSGTPLPAGWSITIQRVVPYQQNTSLTNQGAFYPQVVEAALDYLTMETQQLADQITGGPLPVLKMAETQPETDNSNAVATTAFVQDQRVTGGSGYVNVLYPGYGADKNGVNDSTAAFLAAIATGYDVFVPYGTFLVSSLLLANAKQSIFGSSSQNAILKGTNPLETILTAPAYWNGQIRHLNLTRASQVAKGSGANGITVGGNSVGILDDLNVTNSDVNIFHSGATAGAQVLNCWSNYGATAAYQTVDPNIYYVNCGTSNSFIGFYATGAGHEGGGYFLYGCSAWRSTQNGLLVQGAPGEIVNIGIIDDFMCSCTATGPGMKFDSVGGSWQINNPYIEWVGSGSVSGGVVNWSTPTPGVSGILVTANNENTFFTGGLIYGSSGHGMEIWAYDVSIHGSKVLGSSYGSPGTYHGIIAAQVLQNFQLIGTKTISDGITTQQAWGIYLAGVNRGMILADNVAGGTVGDIYTAGYSGYPSDTVPGHAATNKIHGNIGSNIPSGVSPLATPAVPNSGTAFPNPYAQTAAVNLWGGTVTGLAINGNAISPSLPQTVILKPGDTITWTGSAAPSWYWNAL